MYKRWLVVPQLTHQLCHCLHKHLSMTGWLSGPADKRPVQYPICSIGPNSAVVKVIYSSVPIGY